MKVDPEILSRLVPLDALRPETRADLARKAVMQECPAGRVLFRVGDAAGLALYLIEGEIELQDAQGAAVRVLKAGTPEAAYRVAHQFPRQLGALCLTRVVFLSVDDGLLDVLLAWDQTDTFQVRDLDDAPGTDWMTRLLQMRAFQRVPPAHLQAIFLRMQRIDAEPGQPIVRQGERGDYFYVITEGRCLVTREQPPREPLCLAELEAGSCFGEEALISDEPRNATVSMLTHGSLRRLAKEDFRQLLNEPLARRLDTAAARERVARGEAFLLDVRLASEFRRLALPGSLNIPLYLLRPRLNLLPAGQSVICVCDTGRRSSIASFVLTQKGYDTYILDPPLGEPD